jgi:hypothetical protein
MSQDNKLDIRFQWEVCTPTFLTKEKKMMVLSRHETILDAILKAPGGNIIIRPVIKPAWKDDYIVGHYHRINFEFVKSWMVDKDDDLSDKLLDEIDSIWTEMTSEQRAKTTNSKSYLIGIDLVKKELIFTNDRFLFEKHEENPLIIKEEAHENKNSSEGS